MTNLTRLLGLVAVLLLMAGTPSRSDAAFITYTQTAIGSGSLGGTAFTNALITITASADTNDVFATPVNNFAVSTPGATVTVAGIGSATFTDSIQAVSGITGNSNGANFAGFTSISAPFGPPLGGFLFATINNSSFATYDLRTAIGPVTGAIATNFGIPFETTAGSLLINPFPTSATFSATFGTAAVPEPSSFALCGIAGLIGVGLTRFRFGRAV